MHDADLATKVQGVEGRRDRPRLRGTGDKEKSQTIDVDIDIDKARKGASKLRNFDREVNTQLMKLVRDKRKAYVMTGHGEITNPESIPPELKGHVPERRTTVFKKRLARAQLRGQGPAGSSISSRTSPRTRRSW